MKYFLVLLCLCVTTVKAQTTKTRFVTDDIEHFWQAYDKITSTRDSLKQLQYLQTLFLDKGTPGLAAIREARRYTPQSYLEVINRYPAFWASVRPNMLAAAKHATEIEKGVDKLKTLYPGLKPATVYFTVGAFRTPGTILDGNVLIGSEMALGDAQTVSTEFPPALGYFKNYLATNPSKEIVFLNVHEYVHTQQKTGENHDLLTQCLYEGVAEFVATLTLQKPSPSPAIAYGQAHADAVKAAFISDMFSPWYVNWLYNNTENPFQTRDLGYYIGYAIAEKYYQAAADKKPAVKTLIELDFEDPYLIEEFIDKTGFFGQSLEDLRAGFDLKRPRVTGLREFENDSEGIPSATSSITINFSEPLDRDYRSTGYGPSGTLRFPEITGIEMSKDGKSVTYYLRLEPNRKYQFVLEQGYRNARAIPLMPYLVQFSTGD